MVFNDEYHTVRTKSGQKNTLAAKCVAWLERYTLERTMVSWLYQEKWGIIMNYEGKGGLDNDLGSKPFKAGGESPSLSQTTIKTSVAPSIKALRSKLNALSVSTHKKLSPNIIYILAGVVVWAALWKWASLGLWLSLAVAVAFYFLLKRKNHLMACVILVVGVLMSMYISQTSPAVERVPENGRNIGKSFQAEVQPAHLAAAVGNIADLEKLHKNDPSIIKSTVNPYSVSGHSTSISNEAGWAPIHFAAFYGHIEVMKWLKDHGVDINTRVAWHFDGQLPMHKAAASGQLEAMKWLKQQGADVNAQGAQGWTVFQSAEKGGQTEVMKWLEQQGVNKTPDSSTEAMATAARTGQVEVMKWLKEKGIDINTRLHGYLPIHHAAIMGQLEAMKWLKEQGASLTDKAGNSDSLIHLAVDNGHLEVLKWLKEQGADLNEEGSDKYGNRGAPIHLAAYAGYIEVLKWLKKQGVDINAKARDDGFTPMHYAAYGRKIEVLEWLKNNKAEMNVKDFKGRTPLGVLRQTCHGACDDETVRWLVNNGAKE